MKTLKNIINIALSKVSNFLKTYPELLSIPAGFIAWLLIKAALQVDPENAPLDEGIFMIIPFSFIQFTIYLFISWMYFGVLFGTFRKYMKLDMKTDFNNLTPWQKIIISYSVFFALVFSLVSLSTALL